LSSVCAGRKDHYDQIHVLWGMKPIQFWGIYLRKWTQNYEYKVRYESEYLFRTRPRALEGASASEWPWSLSSICLTLYPSLRTVCVICTVLV